MIDKSTIDANRLLDLILNDYAGNVNYWWRMVEIVKDYIPPHPSPDTKPTRCSIKCGECYLRDLGRGIFVWDFHYGEASEFLTPEQAILSLMKAPVPPFLLKWDLITKSK
jgi:hypothetical protein